jgi:hypothetical protein
MSVPLIQMPFALVVLVDVGFTQLAHSVSHVFKKVSVVQAIVFHFQGAFAMVLPEKELAGVLAVK